MRAGAGAVSGGDTAWFLEWAGVWRTYLDNGGNFIFTGPGVEQTSIAEGTTLLAYLATDGVLGGQVYRSGLWRRTWWTDNDSGAMFAGPSGEVMLHEYGLSMTAYTLAEIAPSYNTKAVGFFWCRVTRQLRIAVLLAR